MARPKLEVRDRTWEKAADRMHPGPGADYVPPVAHIETPMQKLARMEREFLNACVKYHGDQHYGELHDKAIAIIVQRAQITG